MSEGEQVVYADLSIPVGEPPFEKKDVWYYGTVPLPTFTVLINRDYLGNPNGYTFWRSDGKPCTEIYGNPQDAYKEATLL